MKRIADKAAGLIRAGHGLLTEDLIQALGEAGPGKAPERLKSDETTSMVCGFCSTGRGLKSPLQDSHAINLSADTFCADDTGMPSSDGEAQNCATTSLLRHDDEGELKPIDWENALTVFCERLKDIRRIHEPESVALLGDGHIVTEEMAFVGSLFRFGMGFIHGESNTQQGSTRPRAASKQSFGFDAPPYTYADFEESDTLVFIGANPCIAHPILWQRVMQNKHSPEIIVIDPHKTETAMAATQYYAIQPKSDLTLLYGIANILIASGWIDRPHIDAQTNSFDEFSRLVTHFTTDIVSAATGLDADNIWHLAQTIADGKRVFFWWTMRVNQVHEATRTAQAVVNLALMTGNNGRPL